MSTREGIRIRDRRSKYQFSIHNRIVDEWFPIIGPQGFALYSLYVRMADSDREKSYPSLRMIRDHTGMGLATISDYNHLLEWCDLIYIEEGTRNKSNTYFILDIPEVTPEKLEQLYKEIENDTQRKQSLMRTKAKDLKKQAKKVVVDEERTNLLNKAKKMEQKAKTYQCSPFHKTITQRLNAWQPIQAHWKKPQETAVATAEPADPQLPLIPMPDSAELAETDETQNQDTTLELQSSPAEDTVQTQSADAPPTKQIIEKIGIVGKTADQLSSAPQPILLAWYWYTYLDKMDEKYVPGYIVNQLKSDAPPPSEIGGLASQWLKLNKPDRDTMRTHAQKFTATGGILGSFSDSVPEDFLPGLTQADLNTYYDLYRVSAYLTDW